MSVMQWNQFKSFWCNPVHNSCKIILDSERCRILWVPIFIASHFKIRSFPIVQRHWQDQKMEVRICNVNLAFIINWCISCNGCSISCVIFNAGDGLLDTTWAPVQWHCLLKTYCCWVNMTFRGRLQPKESMVIEIEPHN